MRSLKSACIDIAEFRIKPKQNVVFLRFNCYLNIPVLLVLSKWIGIPGRVGKHGLKFVKNAGRFGHGFRQKCIISQDLRTIF